ncbi:MAG: substrate-binding domain-containing protein, partial [Anaerolineae bacterium]|nr:substrate-binding domain-containing protein [Anaerolineae bacterium]
LARGPSDLWPTAVLCSSDAVALGVLRGLNEAGWRVPEHVSVTGFDDLTLARLANPPLTSVRQPLADMVADALRLATAETAPKPASHLHAPSLVVRASTDFPWRSV